MSKHSGIVRPFPEGDPEEEQQVEQHLRPLRLEDFVGQERTKEHLRIAIEAASGRGEILDHVLFYGPPGLGKTTLAHILAQELRVGIRVSSGPALQRAADLAALLTSRSPGDILFIDEIHRLEHTVSETLYPAMEDFALDIVLGKGPTANSLRIDLPRFTLVGATTRAGALPGPFRDRFGLVERLEFYTDQELRRIVTRSAGVLGAVLDPEGAQEIARRSRGTARVANRLLRRLRDFAEVRAGGVVTREVAEEGCALLEVDPTGLDADDLRILRLMAEHYAGGPVGLSTLAAAVSESEDTIADVIEPYLLQRGLLQRTPRGRMLTPSGFTYLGYPLPPSWAGPTASAGPEPTPDAARPRPLRFL